MKHRRTWPPRTEDQPELLDLVSIEMPPPAPLDFARARMATGWSDAEIVAGGPRTTHAPDNWTQFHAGEDR